MKSFVRVSLSLGLLWFSSSAKADFGAGDAFSCRRLFRAFSTSSQGWLPVDSVRGPDVPRFRRIDHPVSRSVLEIDALDLKSRLEAAKLQQRKLLRDKKSGPKPPLNISKLEFPSHYLLKGPKGYQVVEIRPEGGAGQLNAFMNQGPYGEKDLWASNAHRLARRFQSLKIRPALLEGGMEAMLQSVDRVNRGELSPESLIRSWEGSGVTNDGVTAIQLIQLAARPKVIDAIRDFYAQEAHSNPPVVYEHVARGISADAINADLADPRDRLMPWRLNAPPGKRAVIANNRLVISDEATGKTSITPISHNPTAYARWDLWQSVVDARDGQLSGALSRTKVARKRSSRIRKIRRAFYQAN